MVTVKFTITFRSVELSFIGYRAIGWLPFAVVCLSVGSQ